MKVIAKILLIALIVFLARPAGAYVTSRIVSSMQQTVQLKWAGFPIQWQINPARGANVTGARDQADVFRAAFAAWQAVPTATINFTEGAATAATVTRGFDQINVISTNVTAADYASSAVGRTFTVFFDQDNVVDQFGRNVDFAGQIVEADILFNPASLFSTDTTPVAGRFDLQSVATHEIGHLLGLDHTSITSSVMFPTVTTGSSYARTLSVDEIAGVSTIYPSAAFAGRGSLSGTVRTTANATVYGAIVTAVNANGQPVASAITNPQGQYTIQGLEAGTYTIYAEPMDQPLQIGNLPTLTTIFPGSVVQTNFITRFR